MSETRREFLQKTGCLALAFNLPMDPTLPSTARGVADGPPPLEPSAFLRLDADGTVTVWATRSDMGQGIRTSMAMAVAEELEVDLASVRIQQASTHPRFGDLGVTGGSQSTRGTLKPFRQVGATAREMLLQAAAGTWGVPQSECQARQGAVHHRPSQRKLAFGDLVAKARALPPPKDPPLKARKDFRILGTDVRRMDGPEIVAGNAQFGTDVRLPGMFIASIERCPVFGGKLKACDASGALKVPGVKQVVEVSSGIAVVASDTWAAFEGRAALKIEWEEGASASVSSVDIRRQFEQRMKSPGKVVRKEGDAPAKLAQAKKKVQATYDAPFLAHATMEPMVAVADVRADRCDIYAPTQAANWCLPQVQKLTGLKPEQIEVHIPLLGGGFGRRAMGDFILDAVEVSKKIGAPVKVQWRREDDMQHDFYRPATLHHLEGALEGGQAVAWHHRIVGPSIAASLHMPWPPEATELSGAADLPYGIPALQVEWAQSDTHVPVGFWRAVPASHNPFVTECFLDELAHAAGQDPLDFRLDLLKGEGMRKVGREDVDLARTRKVLSLAAEKAHWKTRKLPKGWGHGIAVHPYLDCGTYVAEVAEVEVLADGRIRVHRVVCAVDCGLVVNPLNARAQMEGGILYGLSAALQGEITLEKGRVKQQSFKDYPVLRIEDMPKVEVHFVKNDHSAGGIGEPGLPPIAPAVGNAVFHATGKRLRSLPMTPDKVLKG